MQLVPVMVSYDRIFERENLANEMIEGEKVDYSFLESVKGVAQNPHDAVGQIFVKYLDPIDLKEYVKESEPKGLNAENLERIAYKLTSDLLERQQKETPMTLNSLLAALLLQHEGKSI